MNIREPSSDDIERLKYIADMLVELEEMAQSVGQSELSMLIGVATLAAVELGTDLTSFHRMERS